MGQARLLAARRVRGGLEHRWLLLALIAAAFLATASYGAPIATDPAAANAAGWNLATNDSVYVTDDWRDRHEVWVAPATDGNAAIDRFPGVIAWLAPSYAVTAVFGIGPSEPDDPLSVPAWPASVTAALTAAIAMGLVLSVFRHLVDDVSAMGATLVVAFATPVFSVAADAAWPHALTLALVASSLHATIGSRPVVVAGAIVAGALTRPHVAIGQAVAVVVGRGRQRIVAVALAALLAGLAALSWYSALVFGTWLPAAGYATEPVLARAFDVDPRFIARQAFGAWFHPTRGVLVLTPVLLVLLPWLPEAWRAAPRWVRGSAIAGLVVLAIQYRLMRWSGGSGFFGYRTSLEGLLLASPLLLLAWREGPAQRGVWRAAGLTAIAIGVAIHTYGAMVGVAPPIPVTPS